MKNYISFLCSLILFSAIVFFACSSEKGVSNKSDLKQLSDYAYMGDIHNNIMSYANDHFLPDESIKTRKEAMEYIGLWTASHVGEITHLAKPSWTQEFNLYSNNLDVQALKRRLEPCKTRTLKEISIKDLETNEVALDEVLFIAKEYKVIDNFEFTKLRELGDKLILNEQGLLSNEELKAYLLGVVDEWENQVYDKESEYGQTLGMTLAVSLASLEYWEENYGVLETRVVPVWIASDIGGAVVGGLTNIAISLYRDRPVTFEGVADAIIIGSATGSLGLVGKVGRWLTKFIG